MWFTLLLIISFLLGDKNHINRKAKPLKNMIEVFPSRGEEAKFENGAYELMLLSASFSIVHFPPKTLISLSFL